MGKTVYVMDASRYSRLNKSRDVCCRRCGGSIRVGDVVVSNYVGKLTKLFHRDCFESLYISL